MGAMIVCDKVCLGVEWTLVSTSVIRGNLPWLMQLLGRGFMTTVFLLEALSLGR